jgi:hypothetical protein
MPPDSASEEKMHANYPRVITVALCLFPMLNSSAEAPNPPALNAQHFQCYNVVNAKTAAPRSVVLRDQFGESKAATGSPVLICNPVSKNNEGMRDSVTHLVCYELRTREARRPSC